MELKENKPNLKIKYDGSITIATGKSKKETHWKNKNMLYSDLVEKLRSTTRTPETYSEYKKMPKTERDRIKDVGGFVGGSLKNGRRKAENVANRTLLTLDLDYVNGDVWSSIELLFDFSCITYSTHTHAPDNQRLRLVIPLARPVLPDEYQAIARMVADDLGIDQFDDTTYEPVRLMYWPSTSCDGEYIFKYQDLEWLNPDDVLARYTFGWQDVSYWPESSRARAKLNLAIKKQEDPLTKKGVIGAFCRTYTISEAIAEFIPDIYIPGADDTRYTFSEGSTTGGIVVYEDKFSYSHHGTDPASNTLCNAFDLIRIHKFGHLDDEVRIDTKPDNLPSFKEMVELATNDSKVRIQLGKDRIEAAKDEFESIEDGEQEVKEADEKWLALLSYSKQGQIKATIDNVKIILENDPNIKDKLAYNEFSYRNTIKGKLPWNNENKIRFWNDNDEAGIRHYLEKVYDITRATQVINDALILIFNQNKFHPVRDYLNSLIWDKRERVETVLIDYFGVEDNVYTRAASRIFICGAVERIFNPGCQLDYVTTIVGKQGIRKGTFYRLMAKKDDWYTELATIKYKEAIEETMGKWIVEMAEMAPTKKSEIEEMKAFITNKSKTIRMAYAHNPTDIPRQYVLVASTNEPTFLKDPTGDRRYLPVDADMDKATKSVVDDLKNDVDQIYAEAVEIYKKLKNKALMLGKEEETLASIEQDNHRIVDDEESTIIEFLDTPLPKDWYEKELYERQQYFNDSLSPKVKKEDGFLRDRICVKEILNELYGVSGKIDIRDSTRINKILQGLKNWEKQKSPLRISGYGLQRGYYRT
ncbi:virulence-associated E family protein [Clostridium manihotivorum]|uniref:Virulence-associated protein E-like domain-containing protein n=1 Tax=Clostridium manihotivorum TaxID=2320868 RepID=A0A410DQC4_9CLOT|nr:virulence-associated E family protein [Clostridium manihotivorum]QAA31231.1 hypothetical protein C1I91_05995 [Clostridium manihotivorum]